MGDADVQARHISEGIMSFAAFRENTLTFFLVTFLIAVPGLFLGPAVMTPAYRITQPALGGMTLLALEMVFALIIDFPLAMVAAAIVSRMTRATDPADGALAGVFFLLVFGLLIVVCIPLQGVAGVFASLALADVLPLAMSSAAERLGAGTLGLMVVLFALFDVVLCTAAGIVGFHWSTLFRRRGDGTSVQMRAWQAH
jgi:hypothetical protein